MKKTIALALVAAMLLNPFTSTAQAFEPIRNRAGIATREDTPEGQWGRRGRRVYRRGRGRRRGGSSGTGIAGAIIGGLIAGAIRAARENKPKTPIVYCDQYGNCWQQYD